jgi:hypothetical protein
MSARDPGTIVGGSGAPDGASARRMSGSHDGPSSSAGLAHIDTRGAEVAAADPGDPIRDLPPQFLGAVRADGAPAPRGRRSSDADCPGLDVLQASDQSSHGVGGFVCEGFQIAAELADDLCLAHQLPHDPSVESSKWNHNPPEQAGSDRHVS